MNAIVEPDHNSRRRRIVLVGGLLAVLLGGARVLPAGADDGPPVACAHGSTAITTKCEMTLARDPGLGYVQSYSIALSRNGGTAWFGGLTVDGGNVIHYFVAAYDTSSGANRWRSYYDSPVGGSASGYRLALSPDDQLVAVTGQSLESTGANQSAYRGVTAVWSATTGVRLWSTVTRSATDGYRLAFSPDSKTLYVGGQVYTYQSGVDPRTGTGDDWAISAYDANSGAERWYTTITQSYIVGNNGDYLDFLSISPDGTELAVTGRRPESGLDDGFGHNRGDEWATAVLNSSTGAVSWLRTYAGGLGYDYPHDVEFSPDGQTVVACGEIQLVQGTFMAAVAAYRHSDGASLWDHQIVPPSGQASFCPALAIGSDAVYVTMQWDQQGTASDYATQAYSLSDGSLRWTATYAQPGADVPTGIALSADGGSVYVSGQSQQPITHYDATTVAYVAATGAERWVANYAGPGPTQNQADVNETIASAGFGARVAVVADSPSADGKTAAALLIYDVSSEVTPPLLPAAVPEEPIVALLPVLGAGLAGAGVWRRLRRRPL